MGYLLSNLKKCRWYFLMVGGVSLLLTLAAIFAANGIGDFTAQIAARGLRPVVGLLMLVLGMYLVQETADYFYHRLSAGIRVYVYENLQKKSFRHLLMLPMDSSSMRTPQSTYSLMENDVDALAEFFSETAPSILYQTIRLVMAIVYIAVVDWRIMLVYLAAAMGSLGIQFLVSRGMEKANARVKSCEISLNTALKDVLDNQILIKTGGAYGFAEELRIGEEKEYARANVHMSMKTMPLNMLGILCGLLPMLFLCLAGLVLIPAGRMEVAAFMTVFYLCQSILPDQLHYVDLLIAAAKIRVSAGRIEAFWKEAQKDREKDADECDKKDMERPDDISAASGFTGGVILKDVSYHYPDSQEWAVKNVSLTIPAGRKTALVGKSGCGKSTLLKLMGGLIMPQRGQVKTSGAVLTGQFPFLFTDTVENNIRYAKEMAEDRSCTGRAGETTKNRFCTGYSGEVCEDKFCTGHAGKTAKNRFCTGYSEEVCEDKFCTGRAVETAESRSCTGYVPEMFEKRFSQACRDAELETVVENLEEGYGTLLTENGKNLSGGQRQRVSVARALNSGASTFLFDESVSALDPQTAKAVIGNILKGYPDATVVMSLHQTEFLPLMDEIYVVEDGRITAQGSYEELRRQGKVRE